MAESHVRAPALLALALVLLAGVGALLLPGLLTAQPAPPEPPPTILLPEPPATAGAQAIRAWVARLCSREESARDAALEEASARGPEVVSALIAALETNPGFNDNLAVGPIQRQSICAALAKQGAAAAPAVELLTRMLRSKEIGDPSAAAGVLGSIGAAAASAVPALVELLSNPPDTLLEPIALNAAATALREIGSMPPAQWDAVRAVAGTEDSPSRYFASAVVLALSTDPSERANAAGAIERALRTGSDIESVAVALAAGAAGSPALPLLSALSESHEPLELRKRVAMALADAAAVSPEARRLLDARLSDPDPSVRATLADSLLSVDRSPETRDRAHRLLVGALAEAEPSGHSNVPAILWMRYGHERARRIAPLLQDERPGVRSGAVRALSFSFDHGASTVDLLRPLLADPSPMVRRRVIEALGQAHTSPDDLGAILLRAVADPAAEVRGQAIDRLGRSEIRGGLSAAHRTALVSALTDADAGVRGKAWMFFVHPPYLPALRRNLEVDREALVPKALAAMRDSDPTVAACAVEVLSLIPAERERVGSRVLEMLAAMPAGAWEGPAEWHVRLPRSLPRYGDVEKEAIAAVIALLDRAGRPGDFDAAALNHTMWRMGERAINGLRAYADDPAVPQDRRRLAGEIASKIASRPPRRR